MNNNKCWFAAGLLGLSLNAAAGNTELDSNSSITSGDNNTLIGTDAGASTSTQSGNTLVGNQAGYNNQADENLFVGYQSGYSNTTGARNSFVGTQAGYSNITGEDNTFFGTKAGFANTGSHNTFIGEEAGLENTSGYDNTFLGEDAGRKNLSGYRNTAAGSRAMYGSGYGSDNGYDGWGNTVFGTDAGMDISDGIRNTLIGKEAGIDIGFGNFNTMVGARVGEHTEHGDYNTFVGVLAGRENNRTNEEDNANRNTYLGVGAGSVNRIGSDNVVLGAFADFAEWTDNAADTETGFLAGWGDTTGMPNIADLGEGSSYEISRVTVLGAAAVGSASDAVVIGYGAEATVSAGNGSIAVGTNTTVQHSNAIVIGDNASSHADNTLVLGNDSTVGWQPYADGQTALGSTSYRFADTVAQTFTTLGDTDGSASWTLTADAGEDAGDSWQISAADGGDLTFGNDVSGSYVAAMTLANNGDLSISGDLTLASDARLKTAIEPVDNGLQLVSLLRGVSYRWKEELYRDEERHYGFIAQEVEAVLPELVTENADGIKSVNYVEVTPLLIDALQQLDAESRTIDEEMAQLQAEIEQLAQRAGVE